MIVTANYDVKTNIIIIISSSSSSNIVVIIMIIIKRIASAHGRWHDLHTEFRCLSSVQSVFIVDTQCSKSKFILMLLNIRIYVICILNVPLVMVFVPGFIKIRVFCEDLLTRNHPHSSGKWTTLHFGIAESGGLMLYLSLQWPLASRPSYWIFANINQLIRNLSRKLAVSHLCWLSWIWRLKALLCLNHFRCHDVHTGFNKMNRLESYYHKHDKITTNFQTILKPLHLRIWMKTRKKRQ
jgi:hypothetical protein